ncbi:MAG: hypothetical protein K8T26_03760 [Lentisphaerae bacterium]|nr:hypothetical protein [Lentisphaerota bacterium]
MNLVDKEAFLHNFFYVLCRRKILILVTFLLTLAMVFFAGFLLTPTWEAEALLLVDAPTRANPSPFPGLMSPQPPASTDDPAQSVVALLTGKSMAYEMVKRFGLDERKRLKTQEPDTLRDKAKMAIIHLMLAPVTLMQKIQGVEIGPVDWVDKAADDFRKGLFPWVDAKVNTETQVVDLKINGETAELAQAVALALIEQAQKALSDLSAQYNGSTRDAYRRQLTENESRLQTAQAALRSFKEANHGILPSDEVMLKTAKLNELVAIQNRSKSELEVLQAQIASLTAATDDAPFLIASSVIEANTVMQDLSARLHSQEVALAAMLTERTEQHPDVINARTEIRQLKSELQVELVRLGKARESDISRGDAELRLLEQDLQQLPAKEAEAARLTLQVQIYQQLCLSVQSRLEEMDVLARSGIAEMRIKVLDAPVVSQTSDSDFPSMLIVAIVALVFAFPVSVGLPFFVEYWRDPIKGPLDLELQQVPVIGVIPTLEGGEAGLRNVGL